uniref:DUF3741 domain-containing protein n=1 Tax=Fagus sylvatica TaxID=28930 RepID=A0A2N9J5T5_FAGSY
MKDLSFFLLKNSLGAKMKKGIRTHFCNDDGSTSTLNQHNNNINNKANHADLISSSPTLEEMILQLELEEEIARKAKLNDSNGILRGRMSCVNNSDILRSARNALNQYPRFSLDGKDAMYRSSFKNLGGLRGKLSETDHFNSKWSLPATLAGERVVWCKPGVVAKLMGLEAMPVPIMMTGNKDGKEKLSSMMIKRQNLRRRAERQNMERRVAMDRINAGCDVIKRGKIASCSRNGYCVMKPVTVEPLPTSSVAAAWPTRRFL